MHHHAKRKDIAAHVAGELRVRRIQKEVRGEIVVRAKKPPGVGRRVLVLRLALRNLEVDQLDGPVPANEDVAWLDVTMYDAVCRGVDQTVQHV